MAFIPKQGEIYKHFKGNLYQITAVAEHTETGEKLVVYQALYGDFKTFARPLDMFTSRVDREKYPDVTQEFRFELQGGERQRQESAPAAADRNTTEQESTPAEAAGRNTAEQEVHSAEAAGRNAAEQEVHSAEAADRNTTEQEAHPAEAESGEGELSLDPMVLEFLDADSYEQRLNILAGLRHRITDDMITTMAIACDVEVGDGDTQERCDALKTCLLTLEKYECNRLR